VTQPAAGQLAEARAVFTAAGLPAV